MTLGETNQVTRRKMIWKRMTRKRMGEAMKDRNILLDLVSLIVYAPGAIVEFYFVIEPLERVLLS